MIAALLAQGLPAGRAARIGAWLHGRAGELALAEMKGATGFSAGELAAYIRRVLPRT
jgi:NAD(P)H-hydrate epimerase